MRTAKEWGRVAVSLPGWRVLRGIRWRGENGAPMGSEWQPWPDPDDPATAGCLLALLGDSWCVAIEGGFFALWRREDSRALELLTIDEYQADSRLHIATSLGRACIAAAEALGRWPGGAE